MARPMTKTEAMDMKPSDKPTTALTKAEASQWLRAMGEEPNTAWTSIEVKDRIQEILKELDEGEVDLPKGMSAMKKEDLLEEMRKRGLSAGQHETRASMMRKIRADAEALHGGTAETLMGFGKHAALKYAEVKDRHPDYVRWATETVKDEGVATSPKLR